MGDGLCRLLAFKGALSHCPSVGWAEHCCSLDALLDLLEHECVLRLELLLKSGGRASELLAYRLHFVALLLHSTVNVCLKLATLHGFLLVVLIEGLLNFVALVFHDLLDCGSGALHRARKAANGTFPLVIIVFIIASLHRPADEKVVMV